MSRFDRILLSFLLAAAASIPAHSQADPASRSRNQPVEPYRIVGNVYYVGASDITSYLITQSEKAYQEQLQRERGAAAKP